MKENYKNNVERNQKINLKLPKGCGVSVVVGDSIVKKVKGWELSTEDYLFVVKSFPGAKTDVMGSCIKAILENKPERIIIHCVTNDLKNNMPESVV